MAGKYEFTEGMGEISGFGGSYEKGCRQMLKAGLDHLDQHPELDPKFKGYKNIYGVIKSDNDDAKELSKIVCAALDPNEGVTGAMHQAVIETIMWIRDKGWDAYVEVMSKRSEEGDHGNS